MVETGLSDFHRMLITISKTTFPRLPPKIKTYRKYNKFYNLKYRETLLKELYLTNTRNNNISNFIDICMRSLENHGPLKKKYIRGNHLLIMNKELSNAIMHRLKLRKNFLRHRSNENRKKVFETTELSCLFIEKNKKELL